MRCSLFVWLFGLSREIREVRGASVAAQKRLGRASSAADYFAAFDAKPDGETAPTLVAREVFAATNRVGERYEYTPPFPKPCGRSLLTAIEQAAESPRRFVTTLQELERLQAARRGRAAGGA